MPCEVWHELEFWLFSCKFAAATPELRLNNHCTGHIAASAAAAPYNPQLHGARLQSFQQCRMFQHDVDLFNL